MLPSASKAAILVSLDNKEYSSRCDFSAARLFGRRRSSGPGGRGRARLFRSGGFYRRRRGRAGSAEAGGVARGAGFSCEGGSAERWAGASSSSIICPVAVLLTAQLRSQIRHCASVYWHPQVHDSALNL